MEIRTWLLGLGLQSPWQRCLKQCQIYLICTAYYWMYTTILQFPTLRMSWLGGCMYSKSVVLLGVKRLDSICIYTVSTTLLIQQPLTEKSWTDFYALFIKVLFPHWFGLRSPFRMTFQSLWISHMAFQSLWASTWLFSHCGIFHMTFQSRRHCSTWLCSHCLNFHTTSVIMNLLSKIEYVQLQL